MDLNLPSNPVLDVRQSTKASVKRFLKTPFGLILIVFLIIWGVGFVLMYRYFRIPPGSGSFILFLSPYALAVMSIAALAERFRQQLWQEFAVNHNWSFQPEGMPDVGHSLMLKIGRLHKFRYLISGEIDGRPLRIFNYRFTIGSGKASHSYSSTVLGFQSRGFFPSAYLNYKRDNFGIWFRRSISLPEEFQKKFQLTSPKEYELEALQIFTPDLLAFILDSNLWFDLELVNQELLVFVYDEINSLEQVEKILNQVVSLVQQLGPVLDNMQFTVIPNRSPLLSDEVYA